MTKTRQETDILARLKSGDREVIRSLYANLLPRVKKYVLTNSGNEDDAMDVFQESLETILLKVDDVHTSFEGMVIQICKNKWIDRLRKASGDRVRNASAKRLMVDTVNQEDAYIGKELEYLRFRIMEDTFAKLSEKCQQMLAMIQAGKSVNEIVAVMAFSSPNTMYRRKSACIQRWSELIRSSEQYNSLNE